METIRRNKILSFIKISFAVVVFLMLLNNNAYCGKLISVDEGVKGLKTMLAPEEKLMWWNTSKEKPIVVTFREDMSKADFSTHNSRFYFADGSILTSNLIPPGETAVISFGRPGTYIYRVTGLDVDVEGKVVVGN